MKIVVVGYSASGKSTFSKKLSAHYNIPVLHIDTIYFDENMTINDRKVTEGRIFDMMKKDHWIIDGTYRYLAQNRLEQADHIFLFNFGRWTCFFGLLRRYFKYRKKQRDTMALGNPERIDPSFVKWILWDGRKKDTKQLFKYYIETYQQKITIFKKRKDVKKYLQSIDYQGPLGYTG
ncbi:MAG: topology modulation protein [Acholeplasmataceae bacterium]